ncbi:tripartite tricarboxylate transporter TctB family protein [[Pseudomonas] carboxydohydrogena]|uniref:Tripartite tricarboxylate transporter TctB family protein n=1 Tax=Afipia carboxydohydrogena TaxID=290 RepID=A0ABY8BQJ0_AFICR|nr:tripartite tricarboxylate transporter TctB family protein [[Pseudomonas] carboxydohydrogena]WEF51949.1 tripartite tricarboxylate transporter TctB family protein [[Pseudomonas] carboxydohydrogena]
MSEASHDQSGGPAHRTVEMGVAVACIIFGIITIFGSMQVGIGWDASGPQSGFFPFYLGVIIVLSSLMNLNSARAIDGEREFATWYQLKQVLAVIVPTTVYVFVLPYTGIYIASMVLIGGFMMWLGKYPLYKAVLYGVGVPVAIYFMFEKWFLVPLPKGPIEYWLGL